MVVLNQQKINQQKKHLLEKQKKLIEDELKDFVSSNSFIKQSIKEKIIEKKFDEALEIVKNLPIWEKAFYNRYDTSTNRFNRAFTIGVRAKSDEEHYMADVCSAENSFFNRPVKELYGSYAFRDIILKYGFMGPINRHFNVDCKEDLFFIAYTEWNNSNVPTEIVQLHPHAAAHTLHEMFKVMLEWQWAYYELQSEEPMAILSNNILNHYNLDVRDSDTNTVVGALMQLPDAHVVQFLKGNTIIDIPETDLEEPIEFSVWASENGLFNFFDSEYGFLYQKLLNLKKNKDLLNNI